MASAGEILVVTLNTWKASGDYLRRLTLIADGLAALDPDLVLLQEAAVAPAMAVDTGAVLAQGGGYYHLHHPARAKRRVVLGHRVFSTSGLSLLSRGPIVRSRVITLPEDPVDGERIAQIATTVISGRELTVVNLHLTHLAGADGLRQRQLATVLRALDGWPGGDAAILGGDFNCEPDSPPLKWLQAAAGVAADNVWAAAGGPRPTLTTVDGKHPGRRCFDHLFVVGRDPVRGLHWSQAHLVLNDRDALSDGYASDHFGVCGHIAIPA